MSESTSKAKITSAEEFIQNNVKQVARESNSAAQKVETAASDFAKIENNVFYQILLNPELTPAQKKEQVTRALVFTNNKEESQTRLQEFNKFKEYLQFERKRMAQEIISLTDTEAFSELQSVYQEINEALMKFEQSISPLTEIVDAVYTLRMNGVTFDAFREIILDKEEEKKIAELRASQEVELDKLNSEILRIRNDSAKLSQDKWLFGVGPIKQSAREKIAANDIELLQKKVELETLTNSIKDLSSQPDRKSELDGFIKEKSKLRELLDISSDEHKKRQENLVKSAQEFVNKTEERVSNVLEHFNGMNGQIDRLSEANYTMREIYAILNDSTKSSLEANQVEREKLSSTAEEGGDIQKMQRDRLVRDMENHITSLGQSQVDTTSVFADLTSSGHRIKSMKDGNSQQIAKTRAIHTSGVAGVADQLSTVLQAVSAAALGESSEMARMSLERMNKTTQELSQKEALRVAMGTKEVNTELNKALADLEQYGQVIKTATSITRSGLQETKKLLGDLEETAQSVQKDVREAIGVAADVVAGKGGAARESSIEPPKTNRPNPFNLGGSK